MKGFKDKNKKFHPIGQKSGVRKSRDQKEKTKGVRLKRSEFKSKLTKEARENFIESIQDQISDDVNTEIASNPKAYGLTQNDVDNSTNKFNNTIINEIDRRINEQIKEQTELKPMGSFDDAFKKAFDKAQVRKKRFLTENDIDRLSELQLDVILKDVEKRWDKKELFADEGDHNVVIYTNKEDPNYTFEMHPMDDNELEDEDGKELEDPIYHDSWYFFPAKNGQGIPNSPTVISETGGYTKKDAIREFTKDFILYDQEFSS